MVWIKADVDDRTHRLMKIRAAAQGKTMNEVAADALEAYFDEIKTNVNGAN